MLFVFVQTVRDRVDFLPDETDITEGEQQTGSPSGREALASLGMLVVGLVAVVGLAKVESPAIEGAVAAIDAPPSAVGVMIALLVLLPGFGTQRSARPSADQPQPGLRLGYGQHRAHHPHYRHRINLAARPACTGLNATQIVLLVLTVAVGALAAPLGRAGLLQSGVRLVIFAAFLFLAVRP